MLCVQCTEYPEQSYFCFPGKSVHNFEVMVRALSEFLVALETKISVPLQFSNSVDVAVLQQDSAHQGLVSGQWQNLQVQNHKVQVSFCWEVAEKCF